MNESQKMARAASLIDEAQQAINGVAGALFLYEKKIKELEPLQGLNAVGDDLGVHVRTLRRIARSIDKPKSSRCPRTCPQLCPRHKQLKIGG